MISFDSVLKGSLRITFIRLSLLYSLLLAGDSGQCSVFGVSGQFPVFPLQREKWLPDFNPDANVSGGSGIGVYSLDFVAKYARSVPGTEKGKGVGKNGGTGNECGENGRACAVCLNCGKCKFFGGGGGGGDGGEERPPNGGADGASTVEPDDKKKDLVKDAIKKLFAYICSSRNPQETLHSVLSAAVGGSPSDHSNDEWLLHNYPQFENLIRSFFLGHRDADFIEMVLDIEAFFPLCDRGQIMILFIDIKASKKPEEGILRLYRLVRVGELSHQLIWDNYLGNYAHFESVVIDYLINNLNPDVSAEIEYLTNFLHDVPQSDNDVQESGQPSARTLRGWNREYARCSYFLDDQPERLGISRTPLSQPLLRERGSQYFRQQERPVVLPKAINIMLENDISVMELFNTFGRLLPSCSINKFIQALQEEVLRRITYLLPLPSDVSPGRRLFGLINQLYIPDVGWIEYANEILANVLLGVLGDGHIDLLQHELDNILKGYGYLRCSDC